MPKAATKQAEARAGPQKQGAGLLRCLRRRADMYSVYIVYTFCIYTYVYNTSYMRIHIEIIAQNLSKYQHIDTHNILRLYIVQLAAYREAVSWGRSALASPEPCRLQGFGGLGLAHVLAAWSYLFLAIYICIYVCICIVAVT